MRTFLSRAEAPSKMRATTFVPWAIGALAFFLPDDDDTFGKVFFISAGFTVAFLQSEYGQALENRLIPSIRAWWRRLHIRWLKKGQKDHEETHRYMAFAAGRWISMRGYAAKSGKVTGHIGDHIHDLLKDFWEAGKPRKLLCAMRLAWFVTRIGTGHKLYSALHCANKWSQILFCGELTELTFKGVTTMPDLDKSDLRPGRVKVVLHHPTHALRRADGQKHDEFWCARLNGGRPVTYDTSEYPGLLTIKPIPEAPRILIYEDIVAMQRDPRKMFWGWNMITGEYDWWTIEQWTNGVLMGLPGGGKTVKGVQDFLSLVRHPQMSDLYVLDVHKRGAGWARYGDMSRKVHVATNFRDACTMMEELRHGILNWRFEQIEKTKRNNQFVNQQVGLWIDEMKGIYGYVPNPPAHLDKDERKAFIEEEVELHKKLINDIDAWTGQGREAYLHTELIGQKLTTDACLSSTRTNCNHWAKCTALDETTVEGMFGGKKAGMMIDPTRQLRPGQFANRRHTLVEFHQSAITREHAKEKGLI